MVVRMKPEGSRLPGTMNLARRPATKPIRMVQRMPIERSLRTLDASGCINKLLQGKMFPRACGTTQESALARGDQHGAAEDEDVVARRRAVVGFEDDAGGHRAELGGVVEVAFGL